MKGWDSMADMQLSPGVVSPSEYMKFKIKVKAYESEHDCVPFHKLKRNVAKIGDGVTSNNSSVHNLFNTLINKYGSGICETYFNGDTPIVSFSYKVDQNAFNKKENVLVHVFPQGEKHKNYYISSIAIKNSMVNQNVLKLL